MRFRVVPITILIQGNHRREGLHVLKQLNKFFHLGRIGTSTHMTGRNWGVLPQLATFFPIQTILHPHNVEQPQVNFCPDSSKGTENS